MNRLNQPDPFYRYFGIQKSFWDGEFEGVATDVCALPPPHPPPPYLPEGEFMVPGEYA